MENTIKVAIGDKFFDSFAALPRQIQVKVTEFINKFRNNPRSSSINLEKVQNAQDDKIYSARINDTYRTIIAVEENTGVYLILWIDHHDEAYNWAKRKKCKINKELGSIEVFDVVSNEEENNDLVFRIYEKVSDMKRIALSQEKEHVKKQKAFYQRVSDFSVTAEQPVIRGEMFFSGVESRQSLKKRYKDLIKIYHPDNLDGDKNTVQEINSEYHKLCAVYKN